MTCAADFGVEQQARHVRRRADTAVTLADRVRIGLQIGDEFLQVVGPASCGGDDHRRRVGDERHGSKSVTELYLRFW